MRQFWIEGVLRLAVEEDVLLDVDTQQMPEAVEHPWEHVPGLPGRTSRQHVARSVIEIFDGAGQTLLLLGEPGSGKTIALLDLARALADRAEDASDQPVPVVFHLSSWTGTHPSLADWLVDELKAKYYVPERVGRPWLEGHRLVLLLDGLDEVPEERRAACVEAINTFVESYGMPGMAVCCRREEYAALPVRLRLSGAVCLQPLTESQVDIYLAEQGSDLAALRTLLQSDATLRTLAQTPLMLRVMSEAYEGKSLEQLSGPGPDTEAGRRRHLFEAYIERMFARRGSVQPFAREQVERWLGWLARQMQRHTQAIFLIEQLQPSWATARWQRWVYALGSRVVEGAMLGLVLGIVGWLGLAGDGRLLAGDVVAVLVFGLGFGMVEGLLAGLLDAWRYDRRTAPGTAPAPERRGGSLLASLLVLGTAGFLLAGLIDRAGGLSGLALGLVMALFWGMRRIRQGVASDIHTVEALKWSWREAGAGARRGLMIGGAIASALGVIRLLISGAEAGIFYVLVAGLAGAGLVAVVGGLFGGLTRGLLRTKTVPNQGIRLSARNALFGGLFVGAIGGLVFGLMGLAFGNVLTGLLGGLLLGLLAALWYGGLDVVRHYTLRLVLSRGDLLPLDCAHFLDYGARLIFLRRAGGGYLFIHRALLEHFAGKPPEPLAVPVRDVPLLVEP